MCDANPQILIFLFPSYVFIIGYIIRVLSLKDKLPSPKLIDKTKWFDDDDDNYSPVKTKITPREKPSTLLIKIALSQGIAFIYFLHFIIGLFVPERLFYISCEKFLSFAYLIALFSWWYSGVLLRKEFDKDLPQAFYTHRIFWILAFAFKIVTLLITKVFFSIFAFLHERTFIFSGLPTEFRFEHFEDRDDDSFVFVRFVQTQWQTFGLFIHLKGVFP